MANNKIKVDVQANNKIKMGVPGLDTILKGGLREKSSIIISGAPGTGKSIFAMQYLIEGAKNNEPGLFILYDSKEEDLLDYAESLGLELKKYVKKGLIHIIRQPLLVKRLVSLAAPLDLIRNKKIKRVVLDSLTMFSYIHVAEEKDYRKKIIEFLEKMKDLTLVATAESEIDSIDNKVFKGEDFLFDGVILLSKIRQGTSFERVIHIAKMRGQNHSIDIFPFIINKGGIKTYPDQVPFGLLAKDEEKK